MGAVNTTRDDSLVKLKRRGRENLSYRFGSSAVTKPGGGNFWPTALG